MTRPRDGDRSSAAADSDEPRIRAEQLQSLVRAIFEHSGMAHGDADVVADALVTADLRGVHSHGVLLVPYYRKLLARGADPTGRPRTVKDSGASILVDGGNALGPVAATFAMQQAIERAKTTGVAIAAVRGSNHCGAMARYAMLALPLDMIGIAAANSVPTMAPWGGADRILGMNPLAIAIPAAEERSLVLDTAFSVAAGGKIVSHQQQGRALPEGWALDRDGRPTTDPDAAREGLLQPIGDFKGTGLALMVGILSAVLSGASYGTELGDLAEGAHPGRDGHFLLALDVARFAEPESFKRSVDQIIRQIHESRPAPGVQRILVPGERAGETEEERRAMGVPLIPAALTMLTETAGELGVDPGLVPG